MPNDDAKKPMTLVCESESSASFISRYVQINGYGCNISEECSGPLCIVLSNFMSKT